MLSGSPSDIVDKESPPCHPNTRLYIIEIAQKFHNISQLKKILWISGPAGVGKTAIMRSIVQSGKSRIGAALFFSRSNKRTDPRRFVQTIAYQLAKCVPGYQQYVMDQLCVDPMLLQSGTRHLFERLVEVPFCNGLYHTEDEPWLILIDGLDECEGEEAQCEIVEIIGAFACRCPTSPLVWIVASRAEYWLREAFTQKEIQHSFCQEHIEIDSPDARRDVGTYLNSEFEKIRRVFAHHFPGDNWPLEREFSELSRAASGMFLFASTASRFIADPIACNPVNQLSTLLSIIDNGGGSSPEEGNPLSPLHNIYAQILSSISLKTYVNVTRRILGCCRLLPRNTMQSTSFALSCNFLGITQHDAYGSLERLHSVLDVPLREGAATKEMKILHSSFYEYLENRSVSKCYHVGRQEVGVDIVRCSFRILQEANKHSKPAYYTDMKCADLVVSWAIPSGIRNNTHVAPPSAKQCTRDAIKNSIRWFPALFHS